MDKYELVFGMRGCVMSFVVFEAKSWCFVKRAIQAADQRCVLLYYVEKGRVNARWVNISFHIEMICVVMVAQANDGLVFFEEVIK